jgi:hypothetical protein
VTISPRFAPAVLALAAVALIPTVIHSYIGMKADDGRRVAAIPPALAGFRSQPTGRRASWAWQKLQSDDWIERVHTTDTGKILLFAGRSYDPKRLYHHPELAVLYGKSEFANDFEPADMRRLPIRSDIPVHVLRARAGKPGIAAYALHYDGRFLDNPYLFQANAALRSLASGRKPMTLLLVYDPALSKADGLDRSNAIKLLFAAIDSLDAQSRRRR